MRNHIGRFTKLQFKRRVRLVDYGLSKHQANEFIDIPLSKPYTQDFIIIIRHTRDVKSVPITELWKIFRDCYNKSILQGVTSETPQLSRASHHSTKEYTSKHAKEVKKAWKARQKIQSR